MSKYPPSHLEVVAAEFRVLPLRRFIKDQAYWAWVSFWMWLLPPLTALTRVPLMAGCQGYFEYRDSHEFPALHRWYSYRWARSRAASQEQGGEE